MPTQLKRLPIPVKYRLKIDMVKTPTLFREIILLYVCRDENEVSYRVKGQAGIKRMSFDKYLLFYEPCR